VFTLAAVSTITFGIELPPGAPPRSIPQRRSGKEA
jgi:hypothetical protein